MRKILIIFISCLLSICSFTGCAKVEYNAVIVKNFTCNKQWLENNYTYGSYQGGSSEELPKNRTYVVKTQAQAEEIFSLIPLADFNKEMLLVFCYTTNYVREQKLEKVLMQNGVLKVEFNVVKAKPGVGDATAPQTRLCVIRLDKLEFTDVEIVYNGN